MFKGIIKIAVVIGLMMSTEMLLLGSVHTRIKKFTDEVVGPSLGFPHQGIVKVLPEDSGGKKQIVESTNRVFQSVPVVTKKSIDSNPKPGSRIRVFVDESNIKGR